MVRGQYPLRPIQALQATTKVAERGAAMLRAKGKTAGREGGDQRFYLGGVTKWERSKSSPSVGLWLSAIAVRYANPIHHN